jgi:hypothetical protein
VAREEGPDLAALGPRDQWKDELVHLNVNRQRVKDRPAYDVSTTVDRAYDEAFPTYYGIRWIAVMSPSQALALVRPPGPGPSALNHSP